MRFLVILSIELATILANLAQRDHRSIRQEAIWLLSQAIQQAAKDPQGAQMSELQEVAHAPAPVS
jgi:hypothetical protein